MVERAEGGCARIYRYGRSSEIVLRRPARERWERVPKVLLPQQVEAAESGRKGAGRSHVGLFISKALAKQPLMPFALPSPTSTETTTRMFSSSSL